MAVDITQAALAQGPPGADGADGIDGADGTNGTNGAGYGGTSTTSTTLSFGSKAFTLDSSDYAYQAGARVRASSAANPETIWVEGFVTDYSGGVLTIDVDQLNPDELGTGADDWLFNLAAYPLIIDVFLDGEFAGAGTALEFVQGDGIAVAVGADISGTVSIQIDRVALAPVPLTDASTVAIDSTTGDLFRLALTGSHTLGNPTGATDGDSFIVEVTWGGSYTLTLDTKYLVASNVDFVGAQTSGVIMELGVIYHAGTDKFRVVAASMF